MAAEPVLITVQIPGDESDTPVPGAYVMIVSTDRLTPVYGGYTDSSGELSFDIVGPGTYYASVTAKRYLFPASTTLTVPDTDGDGGGDEGGEPYEIVINGSVIPTIDFVRPTLCTVFGYIADPTGLPVQDAVVVLNQFGRNGPSGYVAGSGTGVDGQLVQVSRQRWEKMTDENGYWEVQLPVGTSVRFTITEVGFEKSIIVPNLAVANLRDIPELQGYEEVGVTSDTPATNAFQGNG